MTPTWALNRLQRRSEGLAFIKKIKLIIRGVQKKIVIIVILNATIQLIVVKVQNQLIAIIYIFEINLKVKKQRRNM